MRIVINNELIRKMKKETKIAFCGIFVLLLFISILLIINVLNEFDDSFGDYVILILNVAMMIAFICEIIKNNIKINKYFDNELADETVLEITNSNNIIIVNNISKNIHIEINEKDIKEIRYKKDITLFFMKNRNFIVLPNIKAIYEGLNNRNRKSTKRVYYIVAALVIVLMFSSIMSINDLKTKFNLKNNENATLSIDSYLLDNNGASYVSETLLINGLPMTNEWHSNEDPNYSYNDITTTWNNPNDNYMYFSKLVQSYSNCSSFDIKNKHDYENLLNTNKVKLGDLIYFANKGNKNIIYVSIITNIDNKGIHCMRKRNDKTYSSFLVEPSDIDVYDLYIIVHNTK